MDDYDVFIDDFDIDVEYNATKGEVMKILNERLACQWTSRESKEGMEIDVEPEWKHVLMHDGSILWAYQKMGWRVMWYQQEFATKPPRSWLSFRNPHTYKEPK